ncbi:NF038130 family PEP-CTERM protein [Pelatocladus sp. BLCC-F211]|uniref:NF038130 family PEP-CTERM protein n=1 Tax=Pelatocladus sp. BLCC-F211 TaxID=3342752 RepID=UPI0035BA977D
MTAHIKKILIGTSVAVSMSTIATTPAFATSLTKPTNIQFITNDVANTSANQPNINTWTYAPSTPVYDNTGVGGVNRQVLDDYNNYGNINKATAALTDNDSSTNVELFTSGETVTDHVGFTANLGKKTIKIESVTKADWADGTLATGWLTGFRDAYGGLMSGIATTNGSNMLQDFNSNFTSLVSYLSTNGFKAAGDPNIGGVTYNQKTKDLKIDLVGHLDLSSEYVDTRTTIIDTRATIIDSRTTIIDARATIIDTRKTIVVNGKTVANPTYNKSIPNPTYNQSIPNPTYNQSISNPTYKKSIPNPTYNQNIPNPNYLGFSPNFSRNSTGNAILDLVVFNLAKTAFLQNKPLQISEIAKVTFNNTVSYAYSFTAIDSGAIAGDRNKATDKTSHTGIYSWTKSYHTASVPEPSALLGLMAVGGLFVVKRKVRKNVSFQ